MLRILLLLSLVLPLAAADPLADRAATILRQNCTGCHGAAVKMSGLDLRTSESVLKGGDSGPVLVPGDATKSRLFRLASGSEQPSMPPGKKLSTEDVETLRQWIANGALALTVSSAPEPTYSLEERPILPEERQFWAFRPVNPPSLIANKNPVDALLETTWRAKGLTPSPKADKRTLIRRAYLDVIGIPPSPKEVAAFLGDPSPDAFETVVDRLLASPHYGERWGRHWLDLVRYADSAGFEFDRDRKNAWRYRDWVIESFNKDRAYDDFLRMQIAGDEIRPGEPEGLIATGYLRLGPEANIPTEQTRMDELDDILATTGGAMLGMTFGCARCHNHKFDPIPQKDYYRMQAVFFPATGEDRPIAPAAEVARYNEAKKSFDAQLKTLNDALAKIEAPYRAEVRDRKISELPEYVRIAVSTPEEKRTEGQRLNALQVEKTLSISKAELDEVMPPVDRAKATQARKDVAEFEKTRPFIDTAMTVVEKKGAHAQESHFLLHGSVGSKGSVMLPGILTVASSKGEWQFPQAPEGAPTSLRRKAFAEWITSTENPLTARVMANRIWQHHFGEGIVRTPNNFGRTGEAPADPALLDWLASELVRNGWHLKPLHRLILTSQAYQMASDDIAANRAIDPDNHNFWRMPRQRLEGEVIRDSILEVSGLLDRTVGGPGVFPYINPALFSSSSGRTWPGKSEDDHSTFRRSVYVFSKRTIPLPLLEVFDKPDTNMTCARRNRSTIAPQALILMNSSFVLNQARYLAQRIQEEAGKDPKRQVERGYELALARNPSARELEIAGKFFEGNPNALVDFCQTLFNLNEFAYIQ